MRAAVAEGDARRDHRRRLLAGGRGLTRSLALLAACVAAAATGCGGDESDSFGVRVPSQAMEPTFRPGEEVTADRAAYDGTRPQLGDVVVFQAPEGAETATCAAGRSPRRACPRPTPPSSNVRLVLRIVAGPGDEVAFRDGLVVRDGEREPQRGARVDDPDCDLCDLPEPITVPADHWFLAADNRSGASDSRVWGPVPTDSLIGRVEG